MIKTKVRVLKDIYNFQVKTFFILIHLGSQLFISNFFEVNTKGMYLPLRLCLVQLLESASTVEKQNAN